MDDGRAIETGGRRFGESTGTIATVLLQSAHDRHEPANILGAIRRNSPVSPSTKVIDPAVMPTDREVWPRANAAASRRKAGKELFLLAGTPSHRHRPPPLRRPAPVQRSVAIGQGGETGGRSSIRESPKALRNLAVVT